MADSDAIEWILLDTDLITKKAILPAATGHLYLELNEPGSGSLKIPLDSTAAALITSGMFAQCSYQGAVRGGFFIENIVREQADDSEGGGRWMSISGRGPLALLDDAIIWDDGTTDTVRDFSLKTKGYILKTLIDEAKARGALSVLTYDADLATLDENNVAWTDSESLSLNVGKSLLDVVRQFADLGMDFTITLSGGAFILAVYSTDVGTDKSSTQFLRVGTNCTLVESEERGDAIKNALRIQWQDGYVTASDATSIAAHRRREKSIDMKVAQSAASALTYGSATLANQKNPRTGIRVSVFDGVAPQPFTDYAIGDSVTLDILGIETVYRILGMQVDTNGASFENVGLELNSIFRENELEMSRNLVNLIDMWKGAVDDKKLEQSLYLAITPNCDGVVYALKLSGTKLYIGGKFTHIGDLASSPAFAAYDILTGTWNALGAAITNSQGTPEVDAIDVDGSGNVYIGGWFDGVGGSAIVDLAKYNGATWSALGSPGFTIGTAGSHQQVHAIHCWGSDVYVGGTFPINVGGVAQTTNLARWNGATWNSLGGYCVAGTVRALTHFGTDLYVGGVFAGVGTWNGSNWVAPWAVVATDLARFDGSAWHIVGAATDIADYSVLALAVDSSGALYVGGDFTSVASLAHTHGLAKWAGAWSALGDGLEDVAGGLHHGAYALIVDAFDNLYVGGIFDKLGNGTTANGLARWSAGNWIVLSDDTAVGLLQGASTGAAYALALRDNYGNLFIGGGFSQAGKITVSNLVEYVTTFQALAETLGAQSGCHNPVTIGSPARGLSITAAQVLTIAQAGAGAIGALSAADWATFNGKGDVNGPASATDNHLVLFDGPTGKLIKDGGAAPSGGGLAWSIITADQTATVNQGYICNKVSLLILTLPAIAAVGSIIRVAGMNAGLWKIAQNAGGIIHFGNKNTTTGIGGYLASILTYDAVELVCIVANNEWMVLSAQGNITVA